MNGEVHGDSHIKKNTDKSINDNNDINDNKK